MNDDSDPTDDAQLDDITIGNPREGAGFRPVPDDYEVGDFEEAAKDWDGTRDEAVLVIDPAGDLEDVEGAEIIEDAEDREPKRFHLLEPDGEGVRIIKSEFHRDNWRACVAAVVDEPVVDDELWESLTAREQALLFDRTMDWTRIGDILGLDMLGDDSV